MNQPTEKLRLEGAHLMIDCLDCNREIISNKEKISCFLEALPETLGMKKLITPFVIEYKGGETWDKGGLTAFMLIAESHISIHTFTHDGFLTADVYSCKPFDTQKAIEQFKEFFNAKKCKIQVAKRELEIIREKNMLALEASSK